MTRKELKTLISRCFYALEATGYANDFQASADAAEKAERAHRRMGERFTRSKHSYTLSCADTGRYFACKWALGKQTRSVDQVLASRDDARLAYAAVRRAKIGGRKIKLARADKAALLAVDYSGDMALPGY